MEQLLDISEIKTIIEKQSYLSQRLAVASVTNNKAFSKYKGINRGKSVVLIGAGPTVNNFEPIKDAIYVGCNRAFLFDKVNFDYLFSIDKAGIQAYYKEFFEYNSDTCIKFIGDQNVGANYQIPENIIPLNDKTHRYITNAGIESCFSNYPLDISVLPLINSSTVSIQAMQFILWTQPSKIYIVGIDCTESARKHFRGQTPNLSSRGQDLKATDDFAIYTYWQLKDFANTYYPYTEIISVNPVGLKGIFKDVYTQSYLDANPDVCKESNCELLKI